MPFQLSDVLKAIGPNASLIFAAWIFLSFLQARYDAAIDRYRSLVAESRTGDQDGSSDDAKQEIEIYVRRCAVMSHAVTLGLVSAVLFLLALICGGLDVVFPNAAPIVLIGTIAGILGLALVIVAAVLVVYDNAGTRTQIRQELRGASGTGQDARIDAAGGKPKSLIK